MSEFCSLLTACLAVAGLGFDRHVASSIWHHVACTKLVGHQYGFV